MIKEVALTLMNMCDCEEKNYERKQEKCVSQNKEEV